MMEREKQVGEFRNGLYENCAAHHVIDKVKYNWVI